MNKELRIRLSPDNKQTLKDRKKELFTATGNKITWSAAINSLIASYRDLFLEHEETLCRIHAALATQTRRTHAANAPQTQNPHARETVDLNIKEKKLIKKETPKKRGKHLLPKNFSPPKTIASEAGIDYEGALEGFSDWANSEGKMKTDWVATFRFACRSWMKERFPHLKRAPIKPHGNTEILRDEDMNDTRPSLV